MSVKHYINGKLNLIAGGSGSGGGGTCDCDSKIFTGTAAEYEAQKDTIEDGTIINIIDDTLDGELLNTNVLNRISDIEEELEELKDNGIPGGGGSSNIQYLTQAEYDALPESKLTDGVEYRIKDGGVRGSAKNVDYDNSESGLEAKNMQEAIDEVNGSLKDYFITEAVSSESLSVNGEFVSTLAPIEVANYTPFAIAGWYLGSTNSKYCHLNRCYIKNGLIEYNINSTQAASPRLTVWVLYKLNL